MAKQKHTSYDPMYLAIGLGVAFISIIALFQWGFVGTFIVNFVRLVVGETYPLILVAVIGYGIFLILKGHKPNLTWVQGLGGFFLIWALCILLHMAFFYPSYTGNLELFSYLNARFKNEWLMSQVSQTMAGGQLGTLGYLGATYLFGEWGTYLLSFLMFWFGLSMCLRLNGRLWLRAFNQLGQSIYYIVTQIPKSLNQLQEKIGQVPNEPDSMPKKPTSDESDLDESPVELQARKKQKSPSRFKRFLNRLDLMNQNEESLEKDLNPLSQSSYQPALESNGKQPDWQPFEKDVPIASRAATERQRARRNKQGLELDLDYFDQSLRELKGQSAERRPLTPRPVIQMMDAFEDREELQRDWQNQPTELDMDKADWQPMGQPSPADWQSDPIQPSQPKDLIETEVRPATNQTGHWIDQADQLNDLTGDDVVTHQLKSAETQTMSKPAKKVKRSKQYQLPGKDLLTKIPPTDQSEEYQRINENIDKLESTFESFGVSVKVVKANLGPAVTKYEIEPAVGVKVSRIVSLADDIALALAARDVRIEAPIPGKSLIGIEVPNTQVSPVSFWEVIDPALKSDQLLDVPLGRDVSGTVCLADLSKMPHLLIAGATGSGKSVGINVIICSLLMKAKPEEVKLVMIDPKKVELTLYNDLPHLLMPVVTSPLKAAKALNNVVAEMEDRYEKFAEVGVRNLDGYNEWVMKQNKKMGTGYEKLPKIVVLIDELADLMMVASNEVETAIIRLAQMARAAGIHMIIATQRPSVDVITGIIKANIPSRLAFAVSSGTDSRTILDSVGAEKLLGRGDMLFQPMGRSKPIRVQGAYISDAEVERITDFIKAQRTADYDETMVVTDETMAIETASDDEYFEDAIQLLKGQETISISQLQRHFRIGYNRAARLIDDLEAMGYVSEPDGSKPRQVLIN